MRTEILTLYDFKKKYPKSSLPRDAKPYILVVDGLVYSSYDGYSEAGRQATILSTEAAMGKYIANDVQFAYLSARRKFNCTPEEFRRQVRAALLDI